MGFNHFETLDVSQFWTSDQNWSILMCWVTILFHVWFQAIKERKTVELQVLEQQTQLLRYRKATQEALENIMEHAPVQRQSLGFISDESSDDGDRHTSKIISHDSFHFTWKLFPCLYSVHCVCMTPSEHTQHRHDKDTLTERRKKEWIKFMIWFGFEPKMPNLLSNHVCPPDASHLCSKKKIEIVHWYSTDSSCDVGGALFKSQVKLKVILVSAF